MDLIDQIENDAVRLITGLALAAALILRVWRRQLKSDSLMEKSILA
jgi:hypothetical protein